MRYEEEPDFGKRHEGEVIEVRGFVNNDARSVECGMVTKFNKEFDLSGFEKAMGYYHGSCKGLVL
jgi:hypothetical protein